MGAEGIILKSCDIPAVPMVAMRILGLVEEPGASVSDLQAIIMGDQALSARVLRMANSAYYGLRREIETVSEAIMVMGFDAIKNLALAVSTRDAYKRFGLLEQRMWEHSIGVSVAAGLVARETGAMRPEEAVMAGLLHDVGKVVMNNCEPEKFQMLTERVFEEDVPYAEVEREVFGFSHEEAGGLFASRWGLPGMLCDVIQRHHSCGEAGGPPCRVVALADTMCLKLGIGYRAPLQSVDETGPREALGISGERLAALRESFRQAYLREKMLYQA
ncbi:MAG: HDOD domain-containing protein [Thermodesulfovibrionales bacterium]